MSKFASDLNVLEENEAKSSLAARLPNWTLTKDGQTIERRFVVKGFAKAVYLCNLATYLADKSGHHPDIQLGWGYFVIRYTTHDANGLCETDLVQAEAFDRAVA